MDIDLATNSKKPCRQLSERDSDIVLCNASPTHEHGIAYATFLDQAADGFFRFMLGKSFADVIADTFAKPAHDFSFENVIFAKQHGKIVGMAAGIMGHQHHRCSDEVLVQAKRFPTFRMWAIRLFLGSLWRFLDTIEVDDFYLQAIAVEKSVRGNGVGSQMIDAMETHAIQCNAKRFVLGVASKNKGARRLYERRGMRVAAQWPKRIPVGPYILRMEKPLDSTG